MKITEIITILEVANHHQGEGKTRKRIENTIATLKRSAVAGCKVLYVFEDARNEPPTQVPGFGHNHKLKCENPEAWGVSRIFGLTVIVAGTPLPSLFNTYKLTDYSRLDFCGVSQPVEIEGYAPDLMVSLPALVQSNQ